MKTMIKAGALVLMAAVLARLYQIYGVPYLERFGPPKPPMTRTPLGEDLLKQVHASRYEEVLHRARRVQLLMEDSRRQGFDVSAFEPKFQHALELARRGEFHDALLWLNLIEIRLPHRQASPRPHSARRSAR